MSRNIPGGGGGGASQQNTLNNEDVVTIFNQQFLGNLQDNPPTDIIPSIDGAPAVTLDEVHNRLLDVEEMVDYENKTI